MKQLAIFINIAGPIDHPDHGIVHQVELGVSERGNMEPQASQIIIKTVDPGKAIDEACHLLKKFIKKYHDASGSANTLPKVSARENLG